eukprot:361630-Chlamydomonas_euryale.AAC.13
MERGAARTQGEAIHTWQPGRDVGQRGRAMHRWNIFRCNELRGPTGCAAPEGAPSAHHFMAAALELDLFLNSSSSHDDCHDPRQQPNSQTICKPTQSAHKDSQRRPSSSLPSPQSSQSPSSSAPLPSTAAAVVAATASSAASLRPCSANAAVPAQAEEEQARRAAEAALAELEERRCLWLGIAAASHKLVFVVEQLSCDRASRPWRQLRKDAALTIATWYKGVLYRRWVRKGVSAGGDGLWVAYEIEDDCHV